jgi:CubicO group peptidase (beta-lactamase class C family)
MKHHIKALLFIFISISYFSVAQTSAHENLDSIAKEADKIALQYKKMGWFSGTILVAKNGKTFHTNSFGLENLELNNRNTLSTKFNLGSIVKNYTKVLVLQQIESGQLHLTDTLNKFNLGFPEEISSKITVQHLLNHSSGFEDIFTAQYRENQLAFDTLEKKLGLLRDKPLLFDPGTETRYSNYGYVVLGAILERVCKLSFEQILTKNIFERIGMKNTTFRVENSIKGQSIRYTYLYDNSLKEVGVTEHPGPAGGIESTVEDVQKFYRSLFYSNTLLSQSNPINKYEFAMNSDHWGSYGGGAGVSAAIEVDLLNGFEIVVLANTDNLVAELISGRILTFIKDGSYEAIKPLEKNFMHHYYKEKGKNKFYSSFKNEYKNAGYTQFIGRVINELGMQLLKTKSWDEAFDIINYLNFIFPNAPEAYDSLAFAYYKKGDLKKAETTFKKAQQLKPNFQSDYISNNFKIQ